MKNELKKCHHCSRMNWHERTECSWCYKKLPSMRYLTGQRIINVVIVVASCMAIGALIATAGRL